MKRTTKTIALVSCIGLALTSCISIGEAERRAAAYDAAAAKKVCDTFAPITYDGKVDTSLTKEQIKQYNAKRKAFCAVTN